MTSKERVHAALRREPVDRVPIFMWFHPETAALLSQHLGVSIDCIDDVMFNDIRQMWAGNNHAMEGVQLAQGESRVDEWGIEWVKEGPFNQILSYPLLNANEDEIRNYALPHDAISELVRNMDALESQNDERFIGCDISPCLFELYNRLRGMDKALMDMVLMPEVFAAFMDRCADHSIALAAAALNRYALDWLWTGDDVGGQDALMMSPDCWRKSIKPHLERIFRFGKSWDVWVAYHSCGAVREIIPDLIEIGLDVLNPIQGNCPGMDAAELKQEFGKYLAFMGGVDTQDLLPNGSVQDVERETRKLLDIMARDGGYILAASHTVSPETPLENIFALYAAAGVSKEMIQDRASDVRRRKRWRGSAAH
jgi:uroporphyrinogen decarboxylase